jgi:hypothetical protein
VGFGGIYLKQMYKGERNLTGYNEIKHKVQSGDSRKKI